MKKRIGIIVADYPLGVLLDTTSMAICLAKEGFLVDIFIDRYMYESAKVDFTDKNIRVVTINMSLKRAGGFLSKRIFNISIGGALDVLAQKTLRIKNARFRKNVKQIAQQKPFAEKLIYYQKYFFPQVHTFTQHLKKYINGEYLCLIGVEPRGLISATSVGTDLNIPVIYQNMELLLSGECKTESEKMMKEMERECNQKCVFSTIQDKNRARYLIEDNQLDPQKVKLLSNSFLEGAYKNKTDYLYEKLDIPKDKIIVLYAGNINQSTMSLEIAKSAQKWQDKYVLVLHTWTKFSRSDEYGNQLKKTVDNKKVYLSTEFLESSQFPKLISSAAIGLVFYRNWGPNYYEVGSASNKFIQYLRVGLPVVSIDFPSFKEKIEKNASGICVKDSDSIENALDIIMADYSRYSDNAYALYEKDYNFSKNFRPILESIKNLNT